MLGSGNTDMVQPEFLTFEISWRGQQRCCRENEYADHNASFESPPIFKLFCNIALDQPHELLHSVLFFFVAKYFHSQYLEQFLTWEYVLSEDDVEGKKVVSVYDVHMVWVYVNPETGDEKASAASDASILFFR